MKDILEQFDKEFVDIFYDAGSKGLGL